MCKCQKRNQPTAPSTQSRLLTSTYRCVAKIDKLAILGVRSFDNIRSETIQFHAPLTLIVGHNGSGKTTIIECLKYATTGDLPPNSKGGAFIHDPKLCGEKEVLAQVKLSFKGTSGAKMVATRSLQLTVKKATRVQKTLEGQLLMIKDGERTSLSSRVAELDQIMPQYLGVSRAVLDSVIFCHQDESLWPMSEPSVLKKKFDEIFEALKYTKAIDNIKTLRKKQNEELAKHLINEGHAKVDKDRADKAEKRSQELSQELDVLRGEVEALTTEIKVATAEMDHLFKHAAGFEKVIGTLSGKRIAAQTKRESIQRARQYMKEMDESDDVLTARLEKYEEMVATCQQQVVSQKVQYTTIIDQVEQTRHLLSMKLSEKGKFESEKDNHERQLAKRKSLVTETARRHKIRGFETDLNDDLIRGFMEKIRKLLREQKLNLEKTRQTIREELQEAQDELTRLREQKSVILQAKDYAKREITLNDRKILGFQHEMNSIEFDEGMKSVFDTAVDDIQGQLRKAKKVFDDSRWDQNIAESTKRLEEAEVEHEKLNQELVQSIRHAGNAAKAQFLQKEHKDRQKSLDTMIAAHGEKIAQLVGSNWEPATLERSFSSILGQKREETQSAERQRDGTNRELEQLDFKLSASHATSKRMHMEMASCEQKVREATDDVPDEYEGVVSQLERDRDVLKADFDSFKNLKDYFTKCKATAEENSVCRLCTRQFKNEKELERFIKKLDEQIMKSAQQTASDELKEIEEELKRAREARPSFDSYVRLSKWEIPKVDSELKDLQIQRERILRRIESQDKSVSQAEGSKSDVESLIKTVQIITKYFAEIVSFQNQAIELATDHDGSISRSVDDIEKEQSGVKERIASLRAMLQKLTAKRDESQTQIHKFELELRDQETKLSTATYQLDKKRDLVSRVDELRMASNTQHMKIEEADRKFEELAPKSLNAQAKYDDVYQRGTEKENQQQGELSSLSDSVYQLDHADQEINGYIDRGGAHELSRCEEDIQKHSQGIKQLEKDLNEIATEVKVIESNLSQSEETKRTIGENLRFREDQRDLLFLTNEIADLEAQNAERDRARFAHEAEKMGFKVQTLSADRSSKMGTMKSKDDELRRLVKEWETDYKDAAQNFKKAHIMAETTKAAVEDLGRYGSALDKAIMAYHSLKMEEINRIIQELWQKTYQGTDVDGILIKSDNESAKGNRSYNYRVCMVKQDAEMDMRGRCSAGQKVLACIIIRLALAECFGVNCGLVALDEPTTNLDRDNIRALAESLHEIIKTRQAQSNFQLIVITHDEEFLRSMKCGDFADTYYRVSRNERQKSQIERQGIGGVI